MLVNKLGIRVTNPVNKSRDFPDDPRVPIDIPSGNICNPNQTGQTNRFINMQYVSAWLLSGERLIRGEGLSTFIFSLTFHHLKISFLNFCLKSWFHGNCVLRQRLAKISKDSQSY